MTWPPDQPWLDTAAGSVGGGTGTTGTPDTTEATEATEATGSTGSTGTTGTTGSSSTTGTTGTTGTTDDPYVVGDPYVARGPAEARGSTEADDPTDTGAPTDTENPGFVPPAVPNAATPRSASTPEVGATTSPDSTSPTTSTTTAPPSAPTGTWQASECFESGSVTFTGAGDSGQYRDGTSDGTWTLQGSTLEMTPSAGGVPVTLTASAAEPTTWSGSGCTLSPVS